MIKYHANNSLIGNVTTIPNYQRKRLEIIYEKMVSIVRNVNLNMIYRGNDIFCHLNYKKNVTDYWSNIILGVDASTLRVLNVNTNFASDAHSRLFERVRYLRIAKTLDCMLIIKEIVFIIYVTRL